MADIENTPIQPGGSPGKKKELTMEMRLLLAFLLMGLVLFLTPYIYKAPPPPKKPVTPPAAAGFALVMLGTTPEGWPVYLDKIASQADHIGVVARVKPHTSYHGPVESGLMKMMMIGLGKHVGAA